MMNSSITSGQRESVISGACDAFRKVLEGEFDSLVETGAINRSNLQGVLGQSGTLTSHVATTTRAKIIEMINSEGGYLTLLSPPEGLVIGPTDGKRYFADAQDVFSAYSDPREFGLVSRSTERIEVNVFATHKGAICSRQFGSFGQHFDRLCLTPGQVISFVQNHPRWLSESGDGTMFLLKLKTEGVYRIAGVGRRDGKFGLIVYELSECWCMDYWRRLVVPKIG